MSLSRRRFLKCGSLAASAAFLVKFPIPARAQERINSGPLINYFEIPVEAQQSQFWYFTRSTFEPYVGGLFTGRDTLGTAVQLRLDRIDGYAPNPGTRITTATLHETECFALLFEASSGLPPFSSIQVIEHPVLGRFYLFLNRSDVDGKIYYQAIINRIA